MASVCAIRWPCVLADGAQRARAIVTATHTSVPTQESFPSSSPSPWRTISAEVPARDRDPCALTGKLLRNGRDERDRRGVRSRSRGGRSAQARSVAASCGSLAEQPQMRTRSARRRRQRRRKRLPARSSPSYLLWLPPTSLASVSSCNAAVHVAAVMAS